MDYLLIIDDDPLIGENIKSKLTRLGYGRIYHFVTSTGGTEAEVLYDKYRPKIVITDIQMPMMSGLTLMKRFNQHSHRAVIFVLSSYEDYEYVRTAFLLGAKDYMLKPISIEELSQKLAPLHTLSPGAESTTPLKTTVELEVGENQLIKLALQYISENKQRNITMADVANHVCISYSYFSRMFKKEVGKSFNHYLNQQRIKQAQIYLKDPVIKILDIAKKVGYQNPSEFSKAFKKQVGMNPTQYREKHSNH